MAQKSAIFTIDWESWFCFKPYGTFWEQNDPLVEEPTYYLLDLLRRHQIKATWYCLGWLVDQKRDLFRQILKCGHQVGNHTYYHTTKFDKKFPVDLPFETPYRAPRFHGQKKLYSGGFWLRAMPYWWIKREVKKEGQLFVHPHDLLFEHPDCGNPLKTFERRIGLKTARDKLERLCREIEWQEASQQAKS